MSPRVEEQELRTRAIGGVREEVEAFGSAAPDSKLIRRQGLLAAVVPAAPQRSLFNSVYYDDAEMLAAQLDVLAETYDASGVRAWTVWVPDGDRATAELLAGRGHVLDAEPRAMAMELGDFDAAPPEPAGVSMGRIDATTCAELNDLAYGYGADGFRAGLARETAIRWYGAYRAGEPVGCVGAIEVSDDFCITGVATQPEQRGQGIASWLLCRALADACGRGLTSASLQATRAGAPIYERLGFRDFGYLEMWELRR